MGNQFCERLDVAPVQDSNDDPCKEKDCKQPRAPIGRGTICRLGFACTRHEEPTRLERSRAIVVNLQS